jgi:hypothetical protein
MIKNSNFSIDSYLSGKCAVKFGSTNQHGKCKTCGAFVLWSRGKVAGHKRGPNCRGQTAEEKELWLALPTAGSKRTITEASLVGDGLRLSVSDSSALSVSTAKRSRSVASFIDTMTPGLYFLFLLSIV